MTICLAVAMLACGSPSPPQANMQSIGFADSGQPPNQHFDAGRNIPVHNTEFHFNLRSASMVLVMASITFSSASGTGYVYPNLEVDGPTVTGSLGHHFATVDSDSGEGGPSTSASWSRVESLAAGEHTARLSMDVDADTSAWVFRGMVRVLRLSG